MCLVSMIGDDWNNNRPGWPISLPDIDKVTRAEFLTYKAENEAEIEKLKKEIESLKKLLKAAKIYDEETGQPDCEMDEKVAIIKKVAELVGVDLDDIFRPDL